MPGSPTDNCSGLQFRKNGKIDRSLVTTIGISGKVVLDFLFRGADAEPDVETISGRGIAE